MRLISVLLCDAATVRDGLLHVLGGGLNLLGRERFPAPMSSTLAIILEVERAEIVPDRELPIDIQIVDVEGSSAPFIHIEGGFELGDPDPEGRAVLVPLVFDLANAQIPAASDYRINVRVGQAEPVDLYFDARLA